MEGEMGVGLLKSSGSGKVENRVVKKKGINQDKNAFYQQGSKISTILFSNRTSFQLILELRLKEFAVEAGDMADGNVLWALHLASAGIGAGTEAQFIHFGHHSLGTARSFHFTLRQQGQRAYARSHEQHRRTVLAGSGTSTASYASRCIHALVSILLWDGDRIGIRHAARIDADEAACLQDLVVSTAVDDQVFDHRETAAAPGLNGDGAAILEFAHVELAGGHAAFRAVCTTVDIQ